MNARPQSRQDKLQISVNDICNGLDLEQLTSRQSSRCQLIRDAHDHALYRSVNSPRLETRSLPAASRPNSCAFSRPPTVISRANTMPDEDVMPSHYVNVTQLGAESSQTSLMARPQDGAVCIRSRSAVDREVEKLVNSLSRQCCDVLGPKCCHQCSRVNRRECCNNRYEARFPSLHVSEENFTTSVLVSKVLPELSRRQVQEKVARGEIRRMQFRQSLESRRERRDRKMSNPKNGKEATSCLSGRKSYTYFSNIRDLSNKIMSGQAGESVKLDWNTSQSSRTKPIKTFSDLVCPVFVSPKKAKEEKRPSYVAFYEPPLLPTVCQSVEPAFFAGTDIPYKLPERLPDKLFSDNSGDLGMAYTAG